VKSFRSRRDFLFRSCGGISGLGLAYLLQQDGLLGATTNACDSNAALPSNPLAARRPHFEPRAKAIISLFMSGGVSHVDPFDPNQPLANTPGSRSKARARSSCARAIPDR